MNISAGKRFQQILNEENPLQLVGVINPFIALMAKDLGFKALYLSGAAVANYRYALADIGLTTCKQVLEEVKRMTSCVDLPLIVDIDTGWGGPTTVIKTVNLLIKSHAAGAQIEDQVPKKKRCGHLEGKEIIPLKKMVQKIKAAAENKSDESFQIIARSDAFAVEGKNGLIDRLNAYKEAGADLFFPEALLTLEEFQEVRKSLEAPIIANLTEFGKTPLFSLEELKKANIDIALYPVSVARAMNFAAKFSLETIRKEGSQKKLIPYMQTRKELYNILNYQ